MALTREGISFDYDGDDLTWTWPWKRSESIGTYYSGTHKLYFSSLKEYWVFIGAYEKACRKNKIAGYDEKEILLSWASREFSRSIVIVMRNINPEAKPAEFWKALNLSSRRQFMKDVAVLFFDNHYEASNVMDAIDVKFAEAWLIRTGTVVDTNIVDDRFWESIYGPPHIR